MRLDKIALLLILSLSSAGHAQTNTSPAFATQVVAKIRGVGDGEVDDLERNRKLDSWFSTRVGPSYCAGISGRFEHIAAQLEQGCSDRD